MAAFSTTFPYRTNFGNFHGAAGKIQLASDDTGRHLNLYVAPDMGPTVYVCLHPDDAVTLRDALMQAYPVNRLGEAYLHDQSKICADGKVTRDEVESLNKRISKLESFARSFDL